MSYITDETIQEISDSYKPYAPDREIKVGLVLRMIKDIEKLNKKYRNDCLDHPKYSRERIELSGVAWGLRKAVMIIMEILEENNNE